MQQHRLSSLCKRSTHLIVGDSLNVRFLIVMYQVLNTTCDVQGS